MRNYLPTFRQFCLIILLTLLFVSPQAESQTRDTNLIAIDTAIKKLVNVSDTLLGKKNPGEEMVKEITQLNKRNKLRSLQENLRNSISTELDNVYNYFRKGIDTAGLTVELGKLAHGYNVAVEGILVNPIVPQTARNLTASRLLMKDLLDELDKSLAKTEKYLKDLGSFRRKLDSLSQDTTLYIIPGDSLYQAEYLKSFDELNKRAGPVDSDLNKMISRMLGLQSGMYELRNKLLYAVNRTEDEQLKLFGSLLAPEMPFIGMFDLSHIKEGATFAYEKNVLLFRFFMANNRTVINIYIIFVVLMTLYALYIMKKVRASERNEKFIHMFSAKSPLLVSLFIFSIIFQFLFPNPPVVIKGTGYLVSAILLAIIMYKERDKILFGYFAGLIFLYTLAFISDSILIVIEPGRYLMIFLCIAGMIGGTLYFKRIKSIRRRDKIQKLIIGTAVVLLFPSLCFNITGMYNLSKVLLTSAYYMVLTGVMLYWCYIFVCEIILITQNHFGRSSRVHEGAGKSPEFVHRLVAVLCSAAWVILFMRNFYLYLYLSDWVEYLINEKRTIGQFEFTFEGVLIFITVIVLSVLISKTIAFFADTGITENKSSRLGNWLLLIRIVIITAGIMLALAATGIPIDRLTIVIGSLGVGIGFGLQSSINNLFSGMLIAFERPFQIGDQIEIGNKLGIIKEIGIRSSKLETDDGSIVIIPNGDLLNQQVINWTKSNDRRRIVIKIGVQFGSDLNKCKEILQKILEGNTEIARPEESTVLLDQFGPNGIEFLLSFWVEIYKAPHIKSDIIQSVENEFNKAGIKFTLNFRFQ